MLSNNLSQSVQYRFYRYRTYDILNTDIEETDKLEDELNDYLDDLYNKVISLDNFSKREYLISAYNHKERGGFPSCFPKLGYIREGDIIYADFGNSSYLNEVGYAHFAVVLKVFNSKVLVIPMTSNKEDFKKAYDPVNNPNGFEHLYPLKRTEPLSKDSTLFLNDIKYINTSRIIDVKGNINPNSTQFKDIYNRVVETLTQSKPS